jgi:hypothetical protein
MKPLKKYFLIWLNPYLSENCSDHSTLQKIVMEEKRGSRNTAAPSHYETL